MFLMFDWWANMVRHLSTEMNIYGESIFAIYMRRANYLGLYRIVYAYLMAGTNWTCWDVNLSWFGSSKTARKLRLVLVVCHVDLTWTFGLSRRNCTMVPSVVPIWKAEAFPESDLRVGMSWCVGNKTSGETARCVQREKRFVVKAVLPPKQRLEASRNTQLLIANS